MLDPHKLDHFPWSHLGNVGAKEAQPPRKARDPPELSDVSGAAVLWQGLAELGNVLPQEDLNIKKLVWNQKNRLERMRGLSAAVLIYLLKDTLFFP